MILLAVRIDLEVEVEGKTRGNHHDWLDTIPGAVMRHGL